MPNLENKSMPIYYDDLFILYHLQINGEASFDIPLGHLSQIERNLNYKSLVVEANVTEEINDITLGASSKVRFHDQAVKVQFLRSNSRTFKPGLPYTAYVSKQHSNFHPDFFRVFVTFHPKERC